MLLLKGGGWGRMTRYVFGVLHAGKRALSSDMVSQNSTQPCY